MALYSDIVMDHFMHPRNVGEIPDADGVGDACEIAAGADDTDENGWPDACQTAFGDLNLDGRIDAADLAELMSRWDLAGQGDLDANGTVNAPDVALLLGRWGPLP